MPAWLLSDWMLWVVTALFGLIGFAMALHGLWGDRARGKPHCRKCWYEMTGTPGMTCPECGHVHTSRLKLLASRRHWKKAVAGSLLFMIGLYCHTGPEVQHRRSKLDEKWWQSVIPTTAWIAAMGGFEEDWQFAFLQRRFEDLERRMREEERELPDNALIITSVAMYARHRNLRISRQQRGYELPIRMDYLGSMQRALLRSNCATVMNHKNHPVKGSRSVCLEWLCGLRGDEGTVSVLIDLLQDSDRTVQYRAALALGDTDHRSDLVVPALINLLNSSDTSMQFAAAEALSTLGDRAVDAIPALMKQIENPKLLVIRTPSGDLDLAECMIDALAAIGPAAVADLTALCLHTDQNLNTRAIEALGGMGTHGREAWPLLVELATGEHPARRYKAAGALQNIGRDMCPLLIKALVKGTPQQRARAIAVLEYFVDDHTVRDLLVDLTLRDRDGSAPAEALAKGELDDRQFVKDYQQQLAPMLAHPRREVRALARQIIIDAEAVGVDWFEWAIDQNTAPEEGMIDLAIAFSQKAAPLGPKLVTRMLADPKKYRSATVDMLLHMGKPAARTLSLLLDGLTSEDKLVAVTAREALDTIKPPADIMLPVLYDKLRSTTPAHRAVAIEELLILRERTGLSEDLRAATEVLEEFAQRETDVGIRDKAMDALKRMAEAAK